MDGCWSLEAHLALHRRRAVAGNALAVPVVTAAACAVATVLGATGVCLTGYAACRAVSLGSDLLAKQSASNSESSVVLLLQPSSLFTAHLLQLKSRRPAVQLTADCSTAGTATPAASQPVAKAPQTAGGGYSRAQVTTPAAGLG